MSHIPTTHEVETFSGAFVDTKEPDPATIVLEDIAHALAMTCRYGGHCKRFYSVAEHAVLCSVRAGRLGYNRDQCLTVLHHDDAEAYLQDITRPLKPLLGSVYSYLSNRMDDVIVEALELPFISAAFHTQWVKEVDNWALFVEAHELLPSKGLHWFNGDQGASKWGIGHNPSDVEIPYYWHGGLSPADAEGLYLSRHWELV